MKPAPASDRGMPPPFVHLDPGLPPRIPAERELVWAFSGWAVRPGARLRAATVEVAGRSFPAGQLDAVRLDAEAVLHREGRALSDLACGFWGLAVLPAGRPGEELCPVLAVEWSDGFREERVLDPVAVDTPGWEDAGPESAGLGNAVRETGRSPLVAIVMATYNPDPALFRAQVESIRAQTHDRWICLVEDDRSDEAHWRIILDTIGGDERFRPVRNAVNVGFYRNFERALARVPAEADFVALSDQDDRWAPGRVAALVAALTGAQDGEEEPPAVLAFGNMHVVDRDGRLLSATFWPGLDSRYDSLEALLMANAVTGCACLFRASLLRTVLPFPAFGRTAYHDHWVACCAAATGRIVYLLQSLGDYVQHGGNSLGAQRRPGARLMAKAAAALALAPAVALASLSAKVRRRFAKPLTLLVGLPQAELVCRVAFAETLRRRVPLDRDGLMAIAALSPGPWPAARLIAALLRREPRGKAFRGVAIRLLVGIVTGRLIAALNRLRPAA